MDRQERIDLAQEISMIKQHKARVAAIEKIEDPSDRSMVRMHLNNIMDRRQLETRRKNNVRTGFNAHPFTAKFGGKNE